MSSHSCNRRWVYAWMRKAATLALAPPGGALELMSMMELLNEAVEPSCTSPSVDAAAKMASHTVYLPHSFQLFSPYSRMLVIDATRRDSMCCTRRALAAGDLELTSCCSRLPKVEASCLKAFSSEICSARSWDAEEDLAATERL